MVSARRRLIAFTLLALLVTSCASGQRIDLVSTDAGRTVDVNVGDTIVVSLEGTPGTGFNWDVASTLAPVLQQVGTREQRPTSTGLVGAPETIVHQFKAIASGETTLSLVYRQPFGSQQPAQTFDVRIRVR